MKSLVFAKNEFFLIEMMFIFFSFSFACRTLEKLNIADRNQLSNLTEKRKQEEEEIKQLEENIEVRNSIEILSSYQLLIIICQYSGLQDGK